MKPFALLPIALMLIYLSSVRAQVSKGPCEIRFDPNPLDLFSTDISFANGTCYERGLATGLCEAGSLTKFVLGCDFGDVCCVDATATTTTTANPNECDLNFNAPLRKSVPGNCYPQNETLGYPEYHCCAGSYSLVNSTITVIPDAQCPNQGQCCILISNIPASTRLHC